MPNYHGTTEEIHLTLKLFAREQKVKVEQLAALIKEREDIAYFYTLNSQAETLLNACAEDVRATIEEFVSNIATVCLQPIFGDDATLITTFKVLPKGGIGAYITVKIGKDEGNILESFGGTVADTVSTALRAAYIILSGNRRLLVLDEPYRNLPIHYIPMVKQFLHILVDNYGFQIIMVTNRIDLQDIGNTQIYVQHNDNGSCIERSA
jgi:hypothetical protein